MPDSLILGWIYARWLALYRLYQQSFIGGAVERSWRALAQAVTQSATVRTAAVDRVANSFCYRLLGQLITAVERFVAGLSRGTEIYPPWVSNTARLLPVVGLVLVVLIFPFVGFIKTALVTAGVIFLHLLRLRYAGCPGIYRSTLWVPLLLYVFIAAFGVLTSMFPARSIHDFQIYVVVIPLVFLVVTDIGRREQLEALLWALVFGVALVSVHGLYQYFFEASFIEAGEKWVDLEENPYIKNRAVATFENPNLLAHFYVLTMPLLMALWFNLKAWRHRLVLGGVIGLALMGMLLTYSRGGWLGLAVAISAFAILKDRRSIVVLIMLGAVGLMILPENIMMRLMSITNLQDSSTSHRLAVWLNSIRIIKDHWLAGVGTGSGAFLLTYISYLVDKGDYAPHAHNIYLQIWGELGIVGLVTFMWLLFKMWQSGLRILCSSRSYYHNLAAGLLGSLAGFMAHSLVEYGLWYYKLAVMFWLLVALFMLMEKLYQSEGKGEVACGCTKEV